MIESNAIIYCADVIAFDKDGKIVIVERLDGKVQGYALPGGKQDEGETLSQTAIREILEETGLDLVIDEVFMTCAEPGRDPRGRYVTTVFVGRVTGVPKDEPGKTRVVLLDPPSFGGSSGKFVLDHGDILAAWLARSS